MFSIFRKKKPFVITHEDVGVLFKNIDGLHRYRDGYRNDYYEVAVVPSTKRCAILFYCKNGGVMCMFRSVEKEGGFAVCFGDRSGNVFDTFTLEKGCFLEEPLEKYKAVRGNYEATLKFAKKLGVEGSPDYLFKR